MIASKSLAVVRDRDSPSKCFYSIFFPSLKKYFCIPWRLSPPQRPVCLVGRLGRKKKKARDGKSKERERGFFPLLIAPRALSIFRSLLFLLGYPTGASAEERALETIKKKLFTRWFHGYDSCRNMQYTFLPFSSFFFFTKHAKGSKIHNYISWLRWLNTIF